MGKILAIDYGKKRIGLAITDEAKVLALPLQGIEIGKEQMSALTAIQKVVNERGDIEKIILGLPLLLSGKESEMSSLVREFAKELQEKLQIDVELFDERFTSECAHASLREMNLSRKKEPNK